MELQVTSPCGVNGVLVLLTAIGLLLIRKYIGGGICKSRIRLDGKTVVITGANSGIGKETAKDMARRGARVVMACRNLTRAENAAEQIRRSTGNGNVVIRHLNLASLYSIREFAREFVATEERLDILINNAGVMMCPKWTTEDRFETHLAVNHLGHFLLTNLLLGMLKKSSPSRIVTVSSVAHFGGKIEFDDLFFEKRPYSPFHSYKQSKLANVLFTRELARRMKGTEVTSYCLHPGIVRTELVRHVTTRVPLLETMLVLPGMLFLKSPWQGAQTSIFCAVTEGLERKSGGYFSDCAEKDPAPEAKDDVMARRLWEESARLVGLDRR